MAAESYSSEGIASSAATEPTGTRNSAGQKIAFSDLSIIATAGGTYNMHKAQGRIYSVSGRYWMSNGTRALCLGQDVYNNQVDVADLSAE